MVPMVDVMTFLIVFFILFTTFRASPMGLKVKLPAAVTATKQETTRITVTIDVGGNVYFNDTRTTVDGLQQKVRQQIARNRDSLVIIKADRDVRYAKLIEVMDAVRRVGATRVALAAERPS
ncbi:MAG TPA: biopolymer transporter ExbD [Firmicutes bacterium]|nr:biopolymer transporter ExbD [Bacillota bacterium]